MDIKHEIEIREKELQDINTFLEGAPSGYLGTQRKSGRYYYYQMDQCGKKEKTERKYLSKNNQELITELAKKSYYCHLKPIIENNLAALKILESNYHPELETAIYEDLHEAKKIKIKPLGCNPNFEVKRWLNEEYEQNTKYIENLKFTTDQREKVRSKSELLIANFLYGMRDKLYYRYEKPLNLYQESKCYTVYPDFTIIFRETGRVMYWEHVGMLDTQTYAEDFVWKMNLYIENDILPGRDIICTYESSTQPFDYALARKAFGAFNEK